MNTYYTKFQKEKKINATTTRLANVTVYNTKWKQIGNATVSKWQDVNDVANMIIRDYEISKVWNSKQFSFNQ
jgi:hypothetical protein